ncbi:hypothetical protein H0H92_014161 [Tricholoma furcatifolium]|nr:hypothetical protein H0H92_014161 [Tricholoma furcatifolium]
MASDSSASTTPMVPTQDSTGTSVVTSGELSVEKLSTVTSQDMAYEERKAADQKIKEENFHKSLAAGEQEAAFQCDRCKQRKCHYRQAQMPSADDTMTASFVGGEYNVNMLYCELQLSENFDAAHFSFKPLVALNTFTSHSQHQEQ